MATPITSVTCMSLTRIDGTDCIGDSRQIINDNTLEIGTTLCDIVENTIYPVTSDTIIHDFDTTGRTLSSEIRNNSITSDMLTDDCVTTAKISAAAITTDKIALSAVTTQTIANSAVTAEKINLVTSLSSNGYQIMPGGLIMQWGESGSIGSDGNQTLTFPIPFPNGCLKAFVSIKNTSTTNDDVFARILSYNSTQITVRGEGTGGGPWPGTRSIDYLAIGY